MLKSKKNLLSKTLSLITGSMFVAVPAFASGDPGVQVGNWLTRNVNGIIPGIMLAVCVYFLLKRDWVKVLSFFGLALIVSVIMNWSDMQRLAKYLFDIVFAGI